MDELNNTYRKLSISQKNIESQLDDLDMLEKQILSQDSFKAQFLPEDELIQQKTKPATSKLPKVMEIERTISRTSNYLSEDIALAVSPPVKRESVIQITRKKNYNSEANYNNEKGKQGSSLIYK